MRNKSFLCLVLAFLCPIFLLGQNVAITGKTNVPNALVRLLTYDELFTYEQTKVAETQSDEDGKFTLKADIKEITPAQIAVNLERVDVILSPNGQYDFEIIIPENKEVSYFEKEQPNLRINKINDGNVYSQYIAVQSFIDDYLYNYFNMIYRNRNLSLLDTLDIQLGKNIGKIENDYIKDCIKYRKASVVMSVNAKKAISEYFDNQDVLYLQLAYMDVLHDLLKTDIKDTDFLSRNPQLAELIRMNNIRKSFFSNVYDKKTALKALDDIKKSSKYQKNKVVATNIEKQMNDLTYNAEAPAFELKDKDGNTVKLSDYQDDMVILQFVDKVSPLSNHEFEVLNNLQKQWNDTIKVVTIATKESFDEYVQIFDKQGYKWQLLNLNFNILLLEDYHIKMFPSYVILKKKGRIGMASAPSPDHNLEIHVRRISKYL